MARTKQIKRPSSPGVSPSPSPPKVRIVQPTLALSSERTISPTLPMRSSSSPSRPSLVKEPVPNGSLNVDSGFRSSPPVIPSAQPLQGHDAETNTEGRSSLGEAAVSSQVGDASPIYDESAIDTLGRGVKKLMVAANHLRDLGIERFDLALPKICVMGDQSTGKSSLIEAISAIKVPRAEDTCTRCPLEITLQSSAEPWKCRVSLVKKYFYDDTESEDSPDRLGPWLAKTPEVIPFAVVDDKEQLLFWLSRAQLAVLNPRHHSDRYKTAEVVSDLEQVPFSPNVIRLELSGPTTPNLSFFDLPGIIVQDAEQYIPRLVQSLVREYISAPNCLILFTLPMNNDLANSNAGAMIHDMNAHDRTIGVITKPDTLAPGNIKQWSKVLAGRHHLKLDHGFWVVKNEQDPNVEHLQARLNEMEFFRTNPLFANELSQHKDRFGVSRLQSFLSRQLTLSIRDNLPLVSAKIDDKGIVVENALCELPKPPPANIGPLIGQKISELKYYLDKEIDDGFRPDDFFNTWRKTAVDFRNHLVQSFPTIDFSSQLKDIAALNKARDAKKADGQDKRSEPISLMDSDSDHAPSTKRSVPPSTPQKPTQIKTPSKSEKKGSATTSKSRGMAKIFTPEDIKLRIGAASKGFFGSVDPRVIQNMYAESVCHWQGVVVDFLDATKILCENRVLQGHEMAFKELRSTPLFEKIKDVVKSYLTDAFERHGASIYDQLRFEVGRPLTINDDEYAERKTTAEKEFVEKWVKFVMVANLRELQVRKGNKPVTVDDRKNAESEARALANPYKLEIPAMAATRAYYDCKARVFTDVCNTRVVKGLFEDIRTDLPSIIVEALGLYAPDANQRLRQLAEISPDVARKRAQYEADLCALRKAKDYLKELLTNDTTSEELEREVDNNHADAMES